MTGHHHGRVRGGFIEHTIQGLHAAMDQALRAEHSASAGGLLQPAIGGDAEYQSAQSGSAPGDHQGAW